MIMNYFISSKLYTKNLLKNLTKNDVWIILTSSTKHFYAFTSSVLLVEEIFKLYRMIGDSNGIKPWN